MLSARYGRMKIGRCLRRVPGFEPMLQDPRYLGCSADVLDIASRLCSGRTECSLRVVDQNFDNIKPCYDTLKMHLEAAYMCINGKPIFFSSSSPSYMPITSVSQPSSLTLFPFLPSPVFLLLHPFTFPYSLPSFRPKTSPSSPVISIRAPTQIFPS